MEKKNVVYLVHEDDARLVVPRVPKHLPDQPRRLADVLVDDRRRDDLQEVGVHVCGDRAREERLSRARGPVEEDALGRLDADALEELGVEERELDRLSDLADLFCVRVCASVKFWLFCKKKAF